MKKVFKITLSVLLISAMIVACSKDKGKSNQSNGGTDDPVDNTPTEAEWKGSISATSDVSLLIKELEQPYNIKNVNAAASGVLSLDFPDQLSVDIYLPFRKQDGTAVSGNIKIEEILLKEKGDFILQNRPTQTANAMLVTGGSYFLRATQNGEELKATYSFALPQSSENFDLFEGRDAGNNQNVWDQMQDSGRWQRQLDSTAGADTFYRYCCTDKFKWINCDYFYSCGCPLTKIKVKLPKEYGNLNTQVMCVFKDINAVTSLFGNKDTKLFETGASYEAPIGKDVTIVVMCRRDGKYYFATKDVTLIADGTYDVTPAEVTLAAMKASIAAM
jgi:hypothetical protein